MKKIIDVYKTYYYSPKDFTIQIKNLPQMTEKKAIKKIRR